MSDVLAVINTVFSTIGVGAVAVIAYVVWTERE